MGRLLLGVACLVSLCLAATIQVGAQSSGLLESQPVDSTWQDNANDAVELPSKEDSGNAQPASATDSESNHTDQVPQPV